MVELREIISAVSRILEMVEALLHVFMKKPSSTVSTRFGDKRQTLYPSNPGARRFDVSGKPPWQEGPDVGGQFEGLKGFKG